MPQLCYCRKVAKGRVFIVKTGEKPVPLHLCEECRRKLLRSKSGEHRLQLVPSVHNERSAEGTNE